MKGIFLALAGAALLCACSSANDAGNGQELVNAANMAVAAPVAADNVMTPGNEAAAAPAAAGFDPAKAPIANPTLGKWPYFSLIDGYEPLSLKNKPGDSSREFEKDVAFDRYEFFDGTKLIPVEGRLYTVRALGSGASVFQVQKTYEKLVHDLGGVTVWEGSGQAMVDAKLKFADTRFRGLYELGSEKMGVYMVRTPTREIWVEVYKRWQDEDDSYWLTVVETKNLEVLAKMLDAEAMKSALDKNGHVALYINFDTDKTAIKPDSQPIVEQIVKLLNDNPDLKLEVQGHTDNVGDGGHNLTLSNGRANAVVGALMSAGIGLDRLSPKGYGSTKPITDNGSDDGRAKNRRVELVKR